MKGFLIVQSFKNCIWILDALMDFQADLKSQGVIGNYTKRENLHITLAFIGDYGNPDGVLDAMEQVDFRPIQISLEGVGIFGELFWVGLAEQGIPFDKKRFSPHITLIRKYSCRRGRKIPVSDPPKGSMVATRVSLMRSERGKNGMIYTEIGSVGDLI